MQASFELFDHTADIGVRVAAESLPELLRVAGEGLYSVIGELEPQGNPQPERFEFTEGDLAGLLRDYLSELLLMFERDQRIVTDLQVQAFEPGRLIASGQSRPIDRSNSYFDREVKAVTYHGLYVRQVDGGYEAEYIVDV